MSLMRRGGGALFSSIGTSSVTTSKLYDLYVKNENSTDNGGIVSTLYGIIENCDFRGEINTSSLVIGGIAVMAMLNSQIINCVNYANLSSSSGEGCVGGIVGSAGANTYILNCYNAGRITSTGLNSSVGGLVGENSSSFTISKSYNIGTVSGSGTVGGILGSVTGGFSSSWIYYLDTCGAENAVGDTNGEICDFDGQTKFAYSLAELQTQSTYSNWTFGTYGSATSGWCFVASEILVDGEVQRLVLPRLAWEDLEVLPTYNVTLNANGGRFGQTTTETKVPQSWSVSNIGGYSFTLNSSTGYYVSGNKGVNSSYSLAKVTFTANAGDVVTFSVINSGEANYDYGIFSNLNTTLTASYSADTTNVYKSYKGASSTSAVTLTYTIATSGSNYIYVKFIKDSSASSGNDSLQFKIVESQGTTTTNLTTISQVVVDGGYIDLSKSYRLGYELIGFAESASVSFPTYEIENKKFYPSASGTLYAVWEIQTYTITFNANGGSGSMSSQTYTYGVSQALKANAFTKSGYNFLGWNTSSTATTATYTDGQNIKISANTTLYAIWKSYSPTIYINGTKQTNVPYIENGTIDDYITSYGKQNYPGFFYDSACTDYANLTDSVTADSVLYTKTATLDYLTFTSKNDGTCSVARAEGQEGDFVIPLNSSAGDIVTDIANEAFFGCEDSISVVIPNSVTSIGSNAFLGCYGLTSITIPDSVTSIGISAFAYCESLTSITIPNSVTSIDDYAFCECYGLASITIPNSVTSIGDSAFVGCYGLTSIEIPDSVTSIGDSAFSSCRGLTSVTIGDSVTSIGFYAFYCCTGLTSITIPNNVTSIGNNAFSGCTGLTSIIVSSGNEVYDSRNNCNAIIETASNTLIAGFQNTIIPNSVTSIGSRAFFGCTSLTSIYIPSSVTTISASSSTSSPFSSCSSLLKIYCGASSKPSGWSNYWNYKSSSASYTTTWGVTRAEYDALYA